MNFMQNLSIDLKPLQKIYLPFKCIHKYPLAQCEYNVVLWVFVE